MITEVELYGNSEIVINALCDKIAELEDKITAFRRQIEDMDKCIKVTDDDRRKTCAERDEWRRRALKSESLKYEGSIKSD